MQKTQSGGEHYFFKQPEGWPIKNKFPFPGVEVKGKGGYCCMYEAFFPKGISTYEEFHAQLPVFDFSDFNMKTGESEKVNVNVVLKSKRIQPVNEVREVSIFPAPEKPEPHEFTTDPVESDLSKRIKAHRARLGNLIGIPQKELVTPTTTSKERGVETTPSVVTPKVTEEGGGKTPTIDKETEPGPGRNNRANAQNMFRAGQAGSRDQAVEYLIKLYKNNTGRPDFDFEGHFRDALNVFFKNYIPQPTGEPVKKGKSTAIIQTEFEIKPYTEIKPVQPVSFYENFLLANDFNFCHGKGKLGKTQGLLYIIANALGDKEVCGIISTENDETTMLARLFEHMEWKEKFVNIDSSIVKSSTMGGIKKTEDKIKEFLKRIKKVVSENTFKIILLDPLPRFMDWNQEANACLMLDGLREICKTYKITILGVRNEGKDSSLADEFKYKGSSAISDLCRQVIRAIPVHKRSALAKEKKPKEAGEQNTEENNEPDTLLEDKKSFVLYTSLSSLFKSQAFLFKLNIVNKGTLSTPELVKELPDDMNIVKYLCSKESGQTLPNKIIHFIQKLPEKGCTFEDLLSEFGDNHSEDSIRKAAKRCLDTVKVGTTTYYQAPPPLPAKK